MNLGIENYTEKRQKKEEREGDTIKKGMEELARGK